MEVGHAAHKVYKIRYHIVVCVKYRKKLFLEYNKIEFLKLVLLKIGKRFELNFDAIGTDGDHIHLFVGAAPKYSPSKIFQITKSITAREIFMKFPKIKSELWGGEFWNDGGYVDTVSNGTTADIVRNYMSKQGSSKKKKEFK